jgi:hypothetical protein
VKKKKEHCWAWQVVAVFLFIVDHVGDGSDQQHAIQKCGFVAT